MPGAQESYSCFHSILDLQSDVWWGLGLISKTWQVLFSGSLKGSQTTGSEEESMCYLPGLVDQTTGVCRLCMLNC